MFRIIFAFLLVVTLICGCCNKEEIPGLIEKLNSMKSHDRSQAALDLARCGTKASKAVPRLAELLYDENVGVQSSASYALRKIDTSEARKIMDAIDKNRRK